ncbi:MAG: hypothetical protein MH321_10490 [Leptospiraceae bacterium]|nr:hypothetical protein [Leptospiraceae bacterium]
MFKILKYNKQDTLRFIFRFPINVLLTTIFFIHIIINNNGLYSQSVDKDSSLIRYYLNQKQYKEARNTLLNSSIYSESSPQYELLETEIWIEEAEHKYQQGMFKSSFELFKKASSRWSTHPLVRERIAEMKNKILKDKEEIQIKKIIPTTINKDESQDEVENLKWDFFLFVKTLIFERLLLFLFFYKHRFR